jgi:transcriptional regulator with XRE-family HTH domain
MREPERSPTEVFSEEVRATRSRKGWSQQRLADELEALDFPIDRSAIAKIESGERGKVSLDEVMAFAYALGVPPMSLIVPRAAGGTIRIAGNVEMPATEATAWWREVDVLSNGDSQRERFFYEAWPDRLSVLSRDVPEAVGIFRTISEFVSTDSGPDAGTVLLMIRQMADHGVRRHYGLDMAPDTQLEQPRKGKK